MFRPAPCLYVVVYHKLCVSSHGLLLDTEFPSTWDTTRMSCPLGSPASGPNATNRSIFDQTMIDTLGGDCCERVFFFG